MVSPRLKEEKAISYFSQKLVESIRRDKGDIDNLVFAAGNPISFLRLLSRFKDYDIIHIQQEYNLLGWFGIPFLLLYLYFVLPRRYLVVTTMHTTPPRDKLFDKNRIKNFLRKTFYTLQNWLINRGSDYIVVHQNFSVNILETYNIPRRKIIVLRQGIIDDLKLPPREKSRRELNLSGKVYLIIGNLAWDNGSDIILSQADKIGKTILVATNPKSVNLRDPSGMSNWISYLQEIVIKDGFSGYVRFDLREIPYSLWWRYFSAADLILLPYRGAIGSGIFTDAMATGRPVVASDVPFFREIAERYGCIELAKNDSDFPRAIKDAMKPRRHRKMVRECKRYLKRNSWTEVGKRYKAFYNGITDD